ncbi:MAG: DUF3307 domain-containing protein [Actinomycetota bacterium]|nr:DUF3307 domain-containing protein [Actinomycetota bacterium]MDZ4180240.1 DUF3307 domain-containing protein [Coriobacteriia bacterium]
MELLFALYIGHLVGDFALQPGWLVIAKRNGFAGLGLHVAVIAASTVAFLATEITTLWWVVVLATMAHLLIEILTLRIRASGQFSGLATLIIDQGAHFASLMLLAYLARAAGITATPMILGFNVGPLVLAFACGILVATFMGSIIVHEATNRFGPPALHRDILPYDATRLIGMSERGLSFVLAVMWGPALIALPFVPRVTYALTLRSPKREAHLVSALTGLLLCGFIWLLFVILNVANT